MAWSSKTSLELFQAYYTKGQVPSHGVDSEGRSMLHLAAQRGNTGLVKFILSCERDSAQYRDKRGRTALHYALESGRAAETVSLLKEAGTSVEPSHYRRHPALHHAVLSDELPAVQENLLVEAGTTEHLNSMAISGITAFGIATLIDLPFIRRFITGIKAQARSLIRRRKDSQYKARMHDCHSRDFLAILLSIVLLLLYYIVR